MDLQTIRKRRKELGISQKEMADKLGVGRQQYSNLETGRTELSMQRLQTIKEILGMQNASQKEAVSIIEEIIGALERLKNVISSMN